VPRPAEAQLVWKTSEWKLAEFQKLVNDPARVKQVYETLPKQFQIDGPAVKSVDLKDGEAANIVFL
jgi:hypothetical protein